MYGVYVWYGATEYISLIIKVIQPVKSKSDYQHYKWCKHSNL